jgi:uncharacterized membrane protein (DUF485 family)
MSTAASSSTYRGRRELGRAPVDGSEFGNASRSALRQRPAPTEPDFAAIHQDPEYIAVKRRLKLFIFPMGVLFLGWYFAYVLLSAYDPVFMSRPVLGSVNMGLVLGMLQFVTTGALTILYGRYARSQIDPRIDKIREQARTHQ